MTQNITTVLSKTYSSPRSCWESLLAKCIFWWNRWFLRVLRRLCARSGAGMPLGTSPRGLVTSAPDRNTERALWTVRRRKNYRSRRRFPLKPACPTKNHDMSIGKPLKNDENQGKKTKNPKFGNLLRRLARTAGSFGRFCVTRFFIILSKN